VCIDIEKVKNGLQSVIRESNDWPLVEGYKSHKGNFAPDKERVRMPKTEQW
jgi:hypothetical protein